MSPVHQAPESVVREIKRKTRKRYRVSNEGTRSICFSASGLAEHHTHLTPEQIDRRKYYVNLTEGSLWISSLGILSVQTVLPALVLRLGGGNIMVGALSVIFYIGAFLPQIFAARITETLPWKKPWAMASGFFYCVSS